LARKEHLWIVAQELRLVNGSGSSVRIEIPEKGRCRGNQCALN
jgi:hypothetical protein